MSNSTQKNEIKQIEKAIDEGFAESEKFLKGMKTPFDKPTQNNEPIINGGWDSPAQNKVDRWVKKDSTQNDYESEIDKNKLILKGMNKAIDILKIPQWSEALQEAYDKGYEKGLADARREVWVDVDCEHSWLPLGDKLRECLKCDRTQVLATLREEEEPKKEKHGCCQCYCSMCRDMCFRSKCVVHTKEETK